jgi:hypothetical protein
VCCQPRPERGDAQRTCRGTAPGWHRSTRLLPLGCCS